MGRPGSDRDHPANFRDPYFCRDLFLCHITYTFCKALKTVGIILERHMMLKQDYYFTIPENNVLPKTEYRFILLGLNNTKTGQLHWSEKDKLKAGKEEVPLSS